MRAAWMMFAVLLIALYAIWLLQPEFEGVTAALLVRGIIAVSMIVAVGYALYERKSAIKQVSELHPEQVAARSAAIRLGLFAILFFSSVFGVLFSSWPAQVFNFEYLLTLPVMLFVVPHYVVWAGRRLGTDQDDHERFGMVLLRKRSWCWAEHKTYLLAWLVKCFFIPLMYAYLVSAIENLLLFSWQWNPAAFVLGLFLLGLGFDLLVAFAGYVLSLRVLGGEIRSVDGTWLGWLVCLICYPPLLGLFHYVKQQVDDIDWSQWLLPSEPLYWLWAGLITFTWVVYWFSTLSFGLKFSNLSWRGLVDCGAYHYTKHPAYLSKNIYWWLHTVPFVGVVSGADLLRNLLGLSFVSLVYYLRAKTEEAHLMQFPEYAAYVARIEHDGLWAKFFRVFRWQERVD
jgi:hypothetical protein